MPDSGRTHRGRPGSLRVPETHCLLLSKDLRPPLPTPQWPAGVHVSTLHDELLPEVHALLCEGYKDGNGSVETLAQWQHNLLHDAEYNRQLCFVVLHDGQVLGVAQCWTSAYLKDLVIHPDARCQGLGRALLTHVFRVFHQRGEACMDLKVMEHNHPARRLYQRLGMTQVQRILA